MSLPGACSQLPPLSCFKTETEQEEAAAAEEEAVVEGLWRENEEEDDIWVSEKARGGDGGVVRARCSRRLKVFEPLYGFC